QEKEILANIGISGKKLAEFLKQDSVQQIKTLIDAFSDFQDTPARFEQGVKLFGRVFPLFNQIINTGTRETRAALAKFAEQFGFQLDEPTALAAERVKTAFQKIEIVLSGFSRRITGQDPLAGIASAIETPATTLDRCFQS